MKKNDAFSELHPIVNFIYFALAIVLSACLMHPVCLAISAVSGVAYARRACGPKAIGRTLRFAVPMMLLTAVLNPLFSHGGVTTLCWLPSGNPLTLESIIYGIAAAVMLFSVLIWFSCFSCVMTTDKFVWLFGRTIPALSLVLSMALRFIPRFTQKYREVLRAQQMLSDAFAGSANDAAKREGGSSDAGGEDEKHLRQGRQKRASILAKLKLCVKAFSASVTWALENSIETADSMRARGYGLEGRTSYSIYSFGKRDKNLLAMILVLGAAVIAGAVLGSFRFSYYPAVKAAPFSALNILMLAAYAALLLIPALTDRKEDKNWKNSL